ncbi:MAG TPA: hypothetical protein VE338_18405, partial [Ktedonobacterales bacterium]|nr:hypothetical protein [Ktedonobacterales bacterium]
LAARPGQSDRFSPKFGRIGSHMLRHENTSSGVLPPSLQVSTKAGQLHVVAVGALTLNGKPALSYSCELG